MKKKVIAILLSVMMAMSTAACGDRDSGESIPASGQEGQSGEAESGTESSVESSGQDMSDIPDTLDANEGAADAVEESSTEAESGAEVDSNVETESKPEGFDWASVDWDGSFDANTSYGVLHYDFKSLLDQRKGDLVMDISSETVEELLANEESLDDEVVVFLKELMKLSFEEITYIQETYAYAKEKESVDAKGFDWTSVDLKHKLFPSEEEAANMTTYSLLSGVNGQILVNDISGEEAVDEWLKLWEHLLQDPKSYDDLDDEVKAILDEFFKLSQEERRFLFSAYLSWEEFRNETE